jgi:hypothetical protein
VTSESLPKQFPSAPSFRRGPRARGPAWLRFIAKVQPDPTTRCWRWIASRTPHGYGRFRPGRSAPWVYAHRFVYELTRGPVPPGLELDHLCRVRACVNPVHLEAVPHRENTLRGDGLAAWNARKTHCSRGHPLPAPGRQGRVCRPCVRVAALRYRARYPGRRAAQQRAYLARLRAIRLMDDRP